MTLKTLTKISFKNLIKVQNQHQYHYKPQHQAIINIKVNIKISISASVNINVNNNIKNEGILSFLRDMSRGEMSYSRSKDINYIS